MDYFTGNSDDYFLLYQLLEYELEGSKSGTARRLMYEVGHNKKQDKESYSITIGHTFRKYISKTKNRKESKIYKHMYETSALTEKPYLLDYLKDFSKYHFPDFEWTEIQVNYNWQSPKHFDKANCGESLIFAMGDYAGGELMIEKENGNELSVNIHNKPFIFDGSKRKHWTNNYQGNRMSIVFYKLNKKLI